LTTRERDIGREKKRDRERGKTKEKEGSTMTGRR